MHVVEYDRDRLAEYRANARLAVRDHDRIEFDNGLQSDQVQVEAQQEQEQKLGLLVQEYCVHQDGRLLGHLFSHVQLAQIYSAARQRHVAHVHVHFASQHSVQVHV